MVIKYLLLCLMCCIGALGPAATPHGRPSLKNCKLCRFSKICNDLPGICILMPYVAIAVVLAALGYLFVTQELLG